MDIISESHSASLSRLAVECAATHVPKHYGTLFNNLL